MIQWFSPRIFDDSTGGTAEGQRINAILNWSEELKERVPTGGR